MSAKTPLHVSPSRHALSAYVYRCLAASFPDARPIPRLVWHEGYTLPALPELADFGGFDWQDSPIENSQCAYPACHKLCGTDGPCDDPWLA